MIIRIKKKYATFIISVLVILLLIGTAVSGENSESIALPVIMYHQVSADGKNTGKYVISAKELENDLIFLKNRGYETVNIKEITEYVNNGALLPEKPVLLSFDDGFESVYSVVEPLMKKYGMKCITSVIGSVAELYSSIDEHNTAYSYLTWDEIKELSLGNRVEVHPHSYDMHYSEKGKRNGMKKKPGETDGQYIAALHEDMSRIHTKLQLIGAADSAMVYPYGIYNDITERMIKGLGYRASFTCEERVNTLRKYDRKSLYKLGRFNRASGISIANLPCFN